MLWLIWLAIVAVSLILITLGIAQPEHSEQALAGFLFLFLLSFPLMQGQLEYQTGSNTTTQFNYVNATVLNYTQESNSIHYTYFNDTPAFKIGLYLAIASVLGFAGVTWSLKGGWG